MKHNTSQLSLLKNHLTENLKAFLHDSTNILQNIELKELEKSFFGGSGVSTGV
jgi:hypothetical protein